MTYPTNPPKVDWSKPVRAQPVNSGGRHRPAFVHSAKYIEKPGANPIVLVSLSNDDGLTWQSPLKRTADNRLADSSLTGSSVVFENVPEEKTLYLRIDDEDLYHSKPYAYGDALAKVTVADGKVTKIELESTNRDRFNV